MNSSIKELVELSRYAGQHPRFVQGGGGNCSVKSDGKMAVKASGFFVEEVTETDGYVIVDLSTEEYSGPENLKPSLEFRLHALLGTHVIHTHPVVVAALVCSEEGRGVFDDLFDAKTHRWIPYETPGRELFECIKTKLAGSPVDKSKPFSLFLQNHGLFVSAPDKGACMRSHEQIVQRLETYFESLKSSEPPRIPESFLTPDHAVYAARSPEELHGREKRAYKELELLALETLTLIRHKKWTPSFLNDNNVAAVLGMDEEKYRQQMLKRKP